MTTWKSEKLGNLVTFKSGGTPSKKNDLYWNGNIPWISAKTMKSDRIISSDLCITEEGLANGSKLAEVGTILLLVRGSGLFNGIPICYVESSVAFNQDIKCINSCSEIENEYIYYWLKANSNYLQAKLDVTGIGAGKFDTKFLSELVINFPDRETRKKIIDFANNLTDKLQVNELINRNLEDQGSVLIQSIFENANKTIAIGNLLGFDGGFAFKSKTYKSVGMFKIITIKNVQDGYIETSNCSYLDEFPDKIKNEQKLSIGDILLSLTGNVGRTGIVCEENLLLNQRVAKVRADKEVIPFIYFLLRNQKVKSNLVSIARGTAQANLSPVEALNVEVGYSEILVTNYKALFHKFYNQIIRNNQENQRLVSMRDSLLPKLMSGELDVSDIEI